ncbi:amino acid permease [Haloarcula nitratireducens]|uniref:Amino acid permease n=1 Tax=Haloarcula nitratireducens TaxID=2487749 RepID=A0AAW4PBF1_9EURY|nr:amino acid permease [Halomicroarcula nitratireducens]MBX0294913.1 amino acid permease [Halomicroarcula nitratireducens]
MDETANASENNPPDHDISEEEDRSMGFWSAAAIGVGTMIAAGIFVLSGLAVSNVGTAAIVSFLLAAFIASLTAASYAEFASVYPESGGGYVYVAKTIPSEITYIMGWTMILGYPASAAFYLGSFSKWFYEFLYDPLSIPGAIPYWVFGLIILGLLVALNMAGAEEAGQFQIVVTALKVVLIGIFLFGVFQAFDPQAVTTSFANNIGDFAQLGVTSALVFITFFGFSAIATDAEEIKDPGETIPKSIYFSMAFVSVIYTLVVIAIVIAVNNQQFLTFLGSQVNLGNLGPAEYVANHGELAMGLAAEYFLGPVGFYIIIAGALVSMLSAANATILAGSRVKLALARNGHLPPSFADTHDSWGTPYKSVLLTGTIITIFLGLFTVVFFDVPGAVGPETIPLGAEFGLEGLANFANILLIFGLSIVNLALIRSRQRFPDIERGFEVPFVPWVPALAVVGNLALGANIVVQSPVIAGLALLAELVGVALWFVIRRAGPSEERLESETPTALAETTRGDHDYQLVVPVANEANVEQLMRTATDLVADRDAELLVMNAVTLPPQTPYAEGRDRVEEGRPVVNRALDIAKETDTPASGTVKLTHDPTDAILNTVEQYGSDGVLMGWGGNRSSARDVVLGSTVDEVAEEADADVFVEKVGTGDSDGKVDSILLPWTDSTHGDLAAETAAAIARTTGASIDVVRVLSEEDRADSEAKLSEAEATLSERNEEFDHTTLDFETRTIESDDVEDTLVEAAEDHDLTAMAAEKEGILQRFVFGSVPEAVADRIDGTTLVAQRNVGADSRLKRLFT